MAVVYEEQNTDISWYSHEITDGTAKDNYERIVELRKAFCHPLTINKDGSLNKKYFSEQTKETAMNWNDIELLQLYQGIFKFGVDSVEKWIKIQNEFLPQRDFIEVRLKLSEIFGTQNLSVYKNKIFETEKDITDEYEKNKTESMKNGNWDTKSGVALRPEIAALTKDDVVELEKSELKDWKKYIYNNPLFIYRTMNQYEKKKSNKRGKGKKKANNNNNKNKNKKKAVKKVQKNTIDQMLAKKKVHFSDPVATENKEIEKMDCDKNENENEEQNNNNNSNSNNGQEQEQKEEQKEDKEIEIIEEKPVKKVQNKNTKKSKKVSKKKSKSKPKSKKLPLLPEDSDDENMLCVE